MNSEWRTRYDLAIDVARTAGDLARNYYETTFQVEHKADKSPVTIADREAEALIRAAIAAAFPKMLPRRGIWRPAGDKRLPLDHRPH